MKKLVLQILSLCIMSLSVTGQDTIVVEAFNFSDEDRDRVITFPTDDHNTYSKILMAYGMRCHDLAVGNGAVGCREWDYSCNTMIIDSSRVDSVLKKDMQGNFFYEKSVRRYEIMSFVTPYGNGLDLGPNGVTWTFDVTDFGPILKGKKRIQLVGGGQNQEEMLIKFYFIKGVPTRDVLEIDQIWPVGFGSSPEKIGDDELYEPRNYILPQGTEHAKVRTIVTGHRQNGEFVPQRHYINLKGSVDEEKHEYTVWKECSTVPVYPQGGTWILDRAGWCPGDPSLVNEFYLTPAMINDGEVEIDYGIFNARFLAEANYIVNNQIVSYGPVNFDLDASIEEVKQPTGRIEYGRFNPSCTNPIVTIKNRGKGTITSLDLEYNLRGGQKQAYSWTGSLDFLDEVDIELPVSVYDLGNGGKHIFECRLTGINGGTDDIEQNNVYYSPFEMVTVYEGETMQVLLTTNKAPKDNEFRITDHTGQTVLEIVDMDAGKGYYEELEIGPGCYRMELTDSKDDGLYYWAYEQNGPLFGRGALQLFLDLDEVRDFEPEFGRFLRYEFILKGATSTNNGALSHLQVYPNPAEDKIQIQKSGNGSHEIQIQIFSLDGKLMDQRKFEFLGGEESKEMDISHLINGAYKLVFHTKLGSTVKTLIKE